MPQLSRVRYNTVPLRLMAKELHALGPYESEELKLNVTLAVPIKVESEGTHIIITTVREKVEGHLVRLTTIRCSSILDSTIHNKLFSSSSLKSISTSTNQHSFTVNYLINSCGLSPETAISSSKYVHFKTLDKPDSVINLFTNHGFSKTQISAVIRKRPTILLSDPKDTLLPKMDFFYSIGISSTELAKIVSSKPNVLIRSLKNQIIPSFNLLKSKLLYSNDKFITAFKRFPEIVAHDHNAITFPNIENLRQHGLPDSSIVFLLTTEPRSLMMKPDRFNEVVDDCKKLGFNPSKLVFVLAIKAMTAMSKSTWKRKMEVYERWGWSEEETMLAFTKHPCCMMISEEKIMGVLNFYVNTMGWESSVIAHRPKLMSLSLGEMIIPRCSVLQVLLSKGLIKKPISLPTLLESTESLFLKKFVTFYEEEAPQLLKLYQSKIGPFKITSR
ncbi:transcription termination factor MTERF8, chloroplastic-like [Cornus florida]|uniref:transcription termination factor MTERF8, chloroplastic-like n=1 Tax=Cornus florida TaxID=4283 RepID=UPI00289A8944|nr:transcription termination factor MTERF8, chloroplastic-like [Cornus florida]